MTFTEDYLATLDWRELGALALNDDLTTRTGEELINLSTALGMRAEQCKAETKRLRDQARAMNAWHEKVGAARQNVLAKGYPARPVTV